MLKYLRNISIYRYISLNIYSSINIYFFYENFICQFKKYLYIYLYRTVAMWKEKTTEYISDHSPATVFKPLLLNMSHNIYEYPVHRKKSRNNGLSLLLLFKGSSMWSSCDVGHKVLMRGGKDVWKLSHEMYLENN